MPRARSTYKKVTKLARGAYLCYKIFQGVRVVCGDVTALGEIGVEVAAWLALETAAELTLETVAEAAVEGLGELTIEEVGRACKL